MSYSSLLKNKGCRIRDKSENVAVPLGFRVSLEAYVAIAYSGENEG
jgi:hypothetical protein